MIKNRPATFLLILISLFLIAGNSFATDRYLSPIGADDSNCADIGDPCYSIIHALTQSGAGDVLHLTAGTYNYDHQVTVDKRVAIVGESSNNTTINISGQHGFLVDQIMLPQAVKFENLHIRGSGNVSTIQTRNSRVLIKDTKITNSLGHGLFISGGQVEVKNNLFYGIALHSIFVAKAPLVPPSPMTQVIIFNNIITATHQTGLFIQNNDPNTIITVARNLFADNRMGALHTTANTPQNGRNTASLFSFNNTFVGNQGPVISADDGSSFNKNNIYAFNDGPDMEPNGLQLGMQQREYNLTFGNTPDNLRFDPNTLNADPKFPATDNGVSSGLTENTLTDALKDWPVDSLRGKFLIANEFKNVYYISGNTSNTITVLVNHPDHELTDMTAVGQPYMIIDGFVLAPDSPAINTGTPAEFMNNADLSRNTRGHMGNANTPHPVVTFKTPKKYTALAGSGMLMADLLINNSLGTTITGYLWEQRDGEEVELTFENIQRPAFNAPETPGNLVFGVGVTDSAGKSFVSGDALEYFVNEGVKINRVGPAIATIGQAISLATPGDTIDVGRGVYFEKNLVIDKSVHIRGAEGHETHIEGFASRDIMSSGPQGAGIQVVNGADISIEGLTIQNMAGPAIHLNPIPEATVQIKIGSVSILNNLGDGVLGFATGYAHIVRSIIGGNTGNGLNVRADKNLFISENAIVGNRLSAITYPAGPAEEVFVLRNILANNESTGLKDRPTTLFESNIVANPRSLSLSADQVRGLAVSNNTFFSMENHADSMTVSGLLGGSGAPVEFINNAVIENPRGTRLTCVPGGEYKVDYNLYYQTAAGASGACVPGAHEKVDTQPLFYIIYNDVVDIAGPDFIRVEGADFIPNEFTGKFLLINQKAFFILENTVNSIKVAVPRDQAAYHLLAYGVGHNTAFKITDFNFNKTSPLFNNGLNAEKQGRSLKYIHRRSFGISDIGANEIPDFTLKMSNAGKAIDLTEGGDSKPVKISILNPTDKQDVTVTLNLPDRLEAEPSVLTFTGKNWELEQTVNLSVIEDAEVQGAQKQDISFTLTSTNPHYNAIAVPKLSVNITDNDTAPPADPAALIVLEETGDNTVVSKDGLTDTYSIKLMRRPDAAVSITPQPTASLKVSTPKLVFNLYNWNKPQTVTVSALKIPDNIGDPPINTSLAKKVQQASHYIDHKVVSTADAFNNYTIARLPVIVRNFQSEENGQADDQDTFTIQTHDGQIVESSQGKIVAVVEGMLQSPTFEFVQSSGPDVVIEAPQITNFGDKLKLVSHITAPKYEPNNSRAFIKLTVTDQDITKSATTMLAIMPKEKELNKQDVSNMSGQILGVNGDGDLIKLVKEPGNGEMLSIVWLSPTVKLYVSNTAVVQTITIGDYVVLSDYTFQHNRGAIVAFNMPKLKRTEYYLYDAVANSYPGIKSYVAPNEGDRAGYVLDKGDLDGDGTEEVWALLPMGENGAGIFVFSLETMVAISRFVESPFNEFSKLLTIADINADTKADLNTGTVAYDSNLVTADDIDSQGQYNAADQIMSFLSSGTEKGVLQMADMSASFEIKPQFPELTPKYKGLIKTATMGGANGLIELTTDLDFNNDAADDIATADSNFLISFYFGSPESEETMASMSIDLSEAVDAILSMAAGDVTGDGVDDLVLGCNDGIIIIIPGSTLYPEEAQLSEDDLIIIFADAGVDVDNMVVADTNGDGIDDITFYDDGKDNTTVIDTYDNFGGNNDNTGNNTTAPVFAGKLSGVAGCSLNPTIVVFSETYHDYLTVAMLLLVLLCVRLRRGTS